MFHVNPLPDKSKNKKCRLLLFLYSALRVKTTPPLRTAFIFSNKTVSLTGPVSESPTSGLNKGILLYFDVSAIQASSVTLT